jgi:deoxyribose-phosphate aldolase
VFVTYNYNQEELTHRCDKIVENEFSRVDRQEVLKSIIGNIDLTTLSGDDTTQKVTGLCNQAISYRNDVSGIPNVAAVCVYPVFAKLVSGLLSGTQVSTACVAGAFPSGQSPLDIRVAEVKQAVSEGADEIDMVISRGRLLEGDFDFISTEVSRIKEACGKAHLKVILETGELGSVENIRKASELSILAGGDFIKTSTGKISPAATPEAFLIMLDTIKEYYEKTGKRIGIKPAGGIAESDEAIKYYLLVKSVLGNDWINKNLFRIGASRLTDNIYNEIIK